MLYREQKRSEDEVVQAVERAIRRGFTRDKQRVLIIKSEGVRLPATKLARVLNERIDGDLVRVTVLGHLVRGGRPSFQDRRVASRMAYAALGALVDGKTDLMTAWRSPSPAAIATGDPAVSLVPLAAVLEETEALLRGESPIMKWRLETMEKISGVLGV